MTTATFASFGNPVINSNDEVAFTTTLAGPGVSAANSHALYLFAYDPLQQTHALALVARAGSPAPGVNNATFGSFVSYVIPDDPAAPNRVFFLAKLAVPAKGQPNPDGFTSANALGAWAQDTSGAVHLLLRAGDSVTVAPGVTKTLKTFTLFIAQPGSYGMSRSFTDSGALVYNATFTDGSQAILTTQAP